MVVFDTISMLPPASLHMPQIPGIFLIFLLKINIFVILIQYHRHLLILDRKDSLNLGQKIMCL